MISPEFIRNFLEKKLKKGQVISVGTSPTSYKIIKELAIQNVLNDLDITFVPTSTDLAHLGKEFNLKLGKVDENIDLLVEFAHEVDVLYNYTKKDTQSLIRDKLVAYYAKEVIVFAKKERITNKVANFPIEISRFGFKKTLLQLETMGHASLRIKDSMPIKTLEQNYIVDLELDKSYRFDDLEFNVKEIPGVLETGIFINIADRIYSVENKTVKTIADFMK